MAGTNPNREDFVESRFVVFRFKQLEGFVEPNYDHNSFELGVNIVPGRPHRINGQFRLIL